MLVGSKAGCLGSGDIQRIFKNFLKAGKEHEVKVWSAEEFTWKLVGLFAGNKKVFIYLESKVILKVNPL